MAEISVPVKLQIQNLQSLVNELQNKLSNLKVGSTGFKAIQNTITAIRGEIDKLSIQTSKPFVDAGQFTKAERSVEKLEDEIEKVSLVMSRLKFSDLELTTQQKTDIKAFEDQLTSIKDKLKVVKNTAKDEFLNSALGQEWLKIDDTAFSKTLSQITNNIRRAVADQNTELNKLEQSAQSYQRALTENQRIKEFISKNNGDPLSQANLGDLYDKIFTTTTKGQFRYTTNGRNLLQDWLENQLHLDDSVIAQIINKNVSATNVGGKLKEVLNNQIQQNQHVVDNNPNITAQVDAAKVKYDELIAILKQVGLSEEQVAATEQVLRSAFSQTTGEFNNYKDKLLAIAQSNNSVQGTTNAMKSQLESLRTTLTSTNSEFIRMQRTQQSFNQMKMAVVNFMGFNQVLNLTKNAIRNAINHIRELDSVMNKISIVTDMSTSDLWGQVDAYSKMAQTYGVSIKGAYEVSQIYYQQGLETNDVLTLTNETLKLARISGLDYAQTTDYMTTALRGFKMEMSEASTVVDVYSNLASHTAVSQEELAVAMSKTASSMESVGATFEEASAMIATMVAVTRESATNIGSAMKSIASRYGELTKDPNKLVDADGEAMAFNKVDAALQSVGISMKTVDGQFREFTDVIVELGEKWDQLESTQQRYIATQFAGNRQQSRFLALVSNVDLLKANMGYAEESEDTGTLQALKALDSIEAKTEQVRVAYQQFYTTIGAESAWKGFLDGAKNVINTLNSFPKLFGKLPVGAIAAITSIITVIKHLGVKLISGIAETMGPAILSGIKAADSSAQQGAEGLFTTIVNTIKGKLGIAQQTGESVARAVIDGSNSVAAQQIAQDKINNNQSIINSYNKARQLFGKSNIGADEALIIGQSMGNKLPANILEQMTNNTTNADNILRQYIQSLQLANEELARIGETSETSGSKIKSFVQNHQGWAKGLQSFGSALHMASMMIDTSKEGGKTLSGTLMSISGAATLAGVAIQVMNTGLSSIPWMAVISGAFALINGISTLIITPEEKLKELEDRAEELNNKAKEAKANYRTLDNSIKKIDELNEKRYEGKEAAEEYQSAVDDLAEKFPQLISGFDSTGNIMIDTTNVIDILSEAYRNNAQSAYEAAKAAQAVAAQQSKIDKDKAESAAGVLLTSVFGVDIEKSDPLFNSFKRAIDSGDSQQISQAYASLIEVANNRKEELQNSELADEMSVNLLQENINELAKTIQDINSSYSILSGRSKAAISAWQQTQINSQGQTRDYIKESSAASAFVTNAIAQDWATYESNKGSSFEINDENYKIIIKENYIEQMDAFWNALNEDQQKLFDQMFSNTEDYTAEDFSDVFSKVQGFDDIKEMITNYYADGVEAIQTRLNASLAKILGKEADSAGNYENIDYRDKSLTVFQREFAYAKEWDRTRGEESYLTKVLNAYQGMRESGYGQRAENFGFNAMELFKDINSAPAEIEKQLWDLIQENSLDTIEGIESIKNTISNNTEFSKYVDIKWLDNLLDNIIPNINLTIQTATNQLLEEWDDTAKELNKAISGGLSLGEADKLISQAKMLGLSFDINKDFAQNGDKLILTADAFNQYWEALNTTATNTATKLQDAINNAISTFEKAESYQSLTEDDLIAIQTIVPNFDFKQYLDAAGRLSNEGIAELAKAIGVSQEGLQNYLEYNRIAAEQVKNSFDWALGNYSSFSNDLEELEKLASGEIELDKENYNAKAIKENINKAYSNLISDVFNKGFTNINLDDYEGLIADDRTALEEILKTGDYTAFLKKYATFAGYTIDEFNQQMAEAIEKDKGLGKAKDAVDLISGGFSLTEFANFLKKYNLGEYYSKFFDDTGKAIGEFEGLFTVNEEGIIEVAEGKEQEVLNIFNSVLEANINSLGDLWKGLLTNNLDKQISDLNKADIGKQASETISSIASAKVGTRINVSKLPPEIQQKLDGNADGIYEVVSEFVRDSALLAIDVNSIDDLEWRAQLKEIQNNIKSKRNRYNGLKGVLSSSFDRNAAEALLASENLDTTGWSDRTFNARMKARGFVWDEYTQQFKATQKAVEWANNQVKSAIRDGASEETIAELRKNAADLAQELAHDKKRDALANLLSNYQDAESVLSDFYAQFGIGFSKDELKQKGILTTDERGKEVIDIDKLNEAIDGYDDLFKDVIEQRVDEYISNAEKAGSLVTQGTTSQTDMSAFQQAYQELTGASIEFIYDPILNAWTFDAIYLRNYLMQAAAKMGLEGDNQKDWVQNQIDTLITDTLDFSNYLSGAFTKKETDKLRKDLSDYFKVNSQSKSFLSLTELEEWAEQQVNQTFEALNKGGQDAVDALKSIKGELSQDEVEAAYRAQIEPIKALADQLDELQVGSVVAKNQIDALKAAGFNVNVDGVVTSTGKLVDAYKSLYDQMKATNEATIAELNSMMGKYLDNKDGEQVVIDALSNAANMTYSQLADIYTQAGIELTESIVDALEAAGIIKGLGGNKMMIQDFKTFAKLMKWDADSEEYLNAFKAYNDAFVNMNRQYESEILAEAKNVTEAKIGDKINLTYLTDAISRGAPEVARELGHEFYNLGATFKDGLLTIHSGADIPGIIARIYAYSEKYGNLLPEELAELADTITEYLSNIINIIQGGIRGSLKNTEAQQLQEWANVQSLGKLDFVQTQDGLKLSQQSAIALYSKLKDIDAIQANLIFKELNDSLKETNENYKSVSELIGYIQDLENKITELKNSRTELNEIDLQKTNAKIDQYEQELSLAKEIKAVRSTSEDNSFNFMSNEIPGAQNNPLNYFENWSKAFKVIDEAAKGNGKNKNKMAYQDFYNIITEMSHLAEISGQTFKLGENFEVNATNAAELIERGASALSIAADGSLKVDLSNLGIDFATGANNLKADVGAGIQDLARSQIEMLNSMIQLLETIVAMEELGNIDVEGNGIDLNEMFQMDENGFILDENNLVQWTQGMSDAANKILTMAETNEDLANGLDQVIVNNTSLREMFQKAKDGTALTESDARAYHAAIAAFYQAMQSGDYDLQNIMSSIKEVLAGTDFEGNIDVGDMHLTFHRGIVLERDKDGNYVVDGQKYDQNHLNAALSAQALSDIAKLQNATKEYNPETGAITYTAGKFNYTASYDVESGQYTVQFSDGDSATADSKEGINLAINTWMNKNQLTQEDLAAKNDSNTASFTYTSKTGVIMDVEVDVQTGEVKIGEINNNNAPENLDQAKEIETVKAAAIKSAESVKAEVDKAAQEATKTVSAESTSIDIEAPKIKLKDNSESKLDISSLKITAEGTPEPIELSTAPEIKLTDEIELKLNISEKTLSTEGDPKIILNNVPDIKPGEEVADINLDLTGKTIQAINITDVQANTIPTITYSGESASLDLNNSTVKTNLENLEAIVTNFNIGNSADPNELVKALTANVIHYIASEDPNSLVADLTGTIEHYTSNDNPNDLVQTLEAIITEYSDLEDPNKLVSTLVATIAQYKATDNPEKLLSDLTGIITEYDDSSAEKPTLDDLIQIINDINTDGADTALDAWRAQQEAKTLNITPKITGMEQEGDTVYFSYEQPKEKYTKNGEVFDPFADIDTTKLTNASKQVTEVSNASQGITAKPTKEVEIASNDIDAKKAQEFAQATKDIDTSSLNEIQDTIINLDTTQLEQIQAIINSIEDEKAFGAAFALNSIEAIRSIETRDAINTIDPNGAIAANDAISGIDPGAVQNIANILSSLPAPDLAGHLSISYSISGGASATGNITNRALAGGATNTLMGELGPELVVSNGRYFLVGQNGAEFVSLANDAIVFNHLQTQRLMEKGAINSHGQPFTNERNAVSYAKGSMNNSPIKIANYGTGGSTNKNPANSSWLNNLQSAGTQALWKLLGIPMPKITNVFGNLSPTSWPILNASARGNVTEGPAQASAKAALAALKQLRAQWQALLGMNAKDFAGLGGSGGGGGGGGKESDPKVFIKQLEIWYNWLQRIAVLEEKINYEEARRNELASSFNPNGKEYVQSQKATLDYLKEEAAVHQSLAESQQEYFDRRRAEMNSAQNPFSALYTFDEYGQLKYKDRGLEQLSQLVGRDALTGKGNMTAQEQYNRLVSMGYGKYMDYDSSGNPIDKEQDDWYVNAVQAFWDKIDSDQKEMQDLHDSIEEHKKAVLEQESKINDIIKEIEDNQIAIENKVLKAVEEMHQREIDEMQKERDAIEKSSQKLIDGLSQQLEKERDMYATKESQEELTSLQRKLVILQRSNGSATEIAALQKELNQKQQDTYFELQQQQIDALQEASDKQLEKLDAQIDLMNETLEYQKLHGMLWEEVYKVLDGTPEEITNFITEHDSQYWGQSPTDFAQNARETLFEAQKFTAQNDILGGISNIVSQYDKKAIEEEARKKREEEEKQKAAAAAAAALTTTTSKPVTSTTSSSGSGSNSSTASSTSNTATHQHNKDGQKYIGSERHYICSICGKDMGVIPGTVAAQAATSSSNISSAINTAVSTVAKAVSVVTPTVVKTTAKSTPTASNSIVKTIKLQYDTGGMVDENGEAYLHAKESVLTARQTHILREEILSNKPTSLLSLLTDFREAYNSIPSASQYSSISSSNTGINIGQATVEMHVASIANDYDAQRAGEQALEKMLSIARKTAGQNRIGG